MKKQVLILFFILAASVANAQFEGNALDFDGTNDMVVVSSVPSVFSSPASNDFTIEAWVNPRGSVFARIFFAQPSTTNFASLGTGAGNVIYFYVISNGTTYSVATSAAITQNAWTHVAARWTAATSTPEVFFNGVLQAGAPGGTSSTGTSGLMVLGSRPGGFQYFNGLLDEVRVWSEARTACEIQNNMNKSITGVHTNLQANYDFNQGTAGGNNTGVTTLLDISGSGYNGTLTNFTLTSTTSNWVASNAVLTSTGNPVSGYSYSETFAVCPGSSYTFPDGSTQSNITSPVTHVSTISGGCDTIITTTVNVNPAYAIADTASVCSGGSYTFPDSSTMTNITSTVSHASMLQTTAGCDSVINTVVNVLSTSAVSETAAVCPGSSYTFPDGSTQNNITSQVVYASTFTNAAGCDSVITTTVDVYPTYSNTDSASICSGSSYVFHDGTLVTDVTASTSYTSILTTINGCDSVINTMLAVNTVDTAVAMINETLTASASGAVYQWLDCANGYAPLAGETNQSFTATVNGNYALAVTENGCTDTSACYLILSTGTEALPGISFAVYPNPANDVLQLNITGSNNGAVELMDVTGAVIRREQFASPVVNMNVSDLASGVYFVKVITAQGTTIRKVEKL